MEAETWENKTMKIKISESDFLVIWDALHTEATVESVALALKLAQARARSRTNKNFSRRGAVAAQKRDVKKTELLQVIAPQKQGEK